MFHRLDTNIELPPLFTNPFDYAPHPLVIMASCQLNAHLHENQELIADADHGKMFGIIVVRNSEGELGFLAAFSGNLAGSTKHPYFVPPIFDLQSVESFFKAEEAEITAINNEISKLKTESKYDSIAEKISELIAQHTQTLAEVKSQYREAKMERQKIRERGCTAEEQSQLQRESQHQKAEIKRLERRLNEELSKLKEVIYSIDSHISPLKHQRHQLSIALQRKIFDHYIVLNHRGCTKSMTDIFEEALGSLPPSGAGECAAPKLLQYAFANNLEIIAMGEYWHGKSPQGEVRHHGSFYPACQSKCRYILGYMLHGMRLAETPYKQKKEYKIEVIYNDNDIAIVNKPAGLLSQNGKDISDLSIESYLPDLFSQHPNAKLVHRLDMDTSGLIVIALTRKSHANLQAQFESRVVKKRYVALLDGTISVNRGEIDLPLIADINDRPRQKVDHTNGKKALTSFDVIEHKDGYTRINLYPHTGRTHQLRVHCSHQDGLNCPIIGDRLYGSVSERLMLHATEISFTHPTSGEAITFLCEPDF